MKSYRAVGLRWADVLGVAVCAASVVSLLPGEFAGRCDTTAWLDAKRALVLSPFLVVMLIRKGWKRAFATLGLNYPLRYPSPFVAGLLGFAMIVASIGLFDRVRTHWACNDLEPGFAEGLAAIIVVSILVVATITTLFRIGARALRRRPSRAASTPASDLLSWVETDAPITEAPNLLFGSDRLAERLTHRLSESIAPLAVVGEVGAGKTSLMKVVRSKVDAQSIATPLAIVPVSVWPYASVEAAVTGILTALTNALGLFVNTWPITGLPSDYIDLIERVEGWPARVANLFRAKTDDPRAVLEYYDRIAQAIGIRFCLWIEDLERLAGADDKVDLDNENQIRLQPVQSLIASLADLEMIGVVLSIGTWVSRFDIEKVVRRVELIPRLEERDVRSVLDRFTEHWGSVAKAQGVELLEPSPGAAGDMSSIAILCSNPRRLKYTIRQAADVWARRMGEINLSDLVVISALRVSEPQVFREIERQIDVLRSIPSAMPHSTSASVNPVDKMLIEIGGIPEPRRSAIQNLLYYLFDQWSRRGSLLSYTLSDVQRLRQQGGGRSYWQRYMSSVELQDDEKDQRIFAAIRSFQVDNRATDLMGLLSEEAQRYWTEYFCTTLLTSEQVIDLLPHAVRHAMAEKPLPDGRSSPVLGSVRRLVERLSSQPDRLREVVAAQLQMATRRNLRVANGLLESFGTSQHSPLSGGSRNAIVRGFYLELCAVGSSEEGATVLRNSLVDAPRYTLLQCCWGLDRLRTSDLGGVPFEGWSDFAICVLSATAIDPAVMAPQVLPFLVDNAERFPTGEVNYVFNAERARLLFDPSRLRQVVLSLPEPVYSDSKAMLAAVRRALDSVGGPAVESAGADPEGD